jgi:hypothetical protein
VNGIDLADHRLASSAASYSAQIDVAVDGLLLHRPAAHKGIKRAHFTLVA